MSSTAQSLASQRINSLLDENSFVEIGGQITARNTDFNLSEKETPSDGVITGYGVIDGNLVYVYSQDASVLNGTIGEMHAKKITNLYNLAMKTGAPVIGLVDCAGFRLEEATDALNGFGEIYTKQALASGVIPQVTGIFGTCGGGLAIASAMTDFTFMEEKKGRLFVNSPNAIDGNEISKCDTSSAKFQSEETGLVDGVGSEEEIIAQMRALVSMLPANNEDDMSYTECTDDLNRVCTELANCVGDTSIALSQIADNNVFFEVKSSYAKDMVTGFIRLNGATVGCVANRTEVYDAEGNKTEEFDNVLSARGCKKAAEFVDFCDAFDIPVLTLTNAKGYKATKCAEANMAKAAAALTYAYTNATVPKVNVVIGAAYGSAYLTMNSKSTGADMVFAWPTAEIGMMDAKLAAKIMYAGADAATINEKAAEYATLQSSAQAAAKRGYVDTIIEAEDTRKYVIGAFEMLFTKREDRPSKKHGTV
ncbi:carboxyl transferase [Lactonifactor sp. BIOML-A3]|uniref:acyl-CoA carboxylase subunit beta n=1 Tax=Lactonifactor TaxID=420345 RepID=UPI0012B0E631|nr:MULTISPECIES: carboxyl transferase domain-containing protein [Lactonifactor]MCB5714752.1 carboxyl transferase [Lactonifactor longoviformis]MCB5718706.1 carboxyl transferase [Lactonifactor longoviformis]MSA01843.1 carboxyl transferase [Lactonifactor sp. BIOML-A5]MSA08357.1 carboxyl transferase [Lactonifactor sp. BIOML-A4]MSA12779.1 carboxyl transferase [Lactonifactor sp. BIOML-A3]